MSLSTQSRALRLWGAAGLCAALLAACVGTPNPPDVTDNSQVPAAGPRADAQKPDPSTPLAYITPSTSDPFRGTRSEGDVYRVQQGTALAGPSAAPGAAGESGQFWTYSTHAGPDAARGFTPSTGPLPDVIIGDQTPTSALRGGVDATRQNAQQRFIASPVEPSSGVARVRADMRSVGPVPPAAPVPPGRIAIQGNMATVLPPSVGGVNPVNGQVHDAMFFEHHGTNPFVDTEDDAQLTFGLDVDTASYTVVRRFLEEGTMPPPEAVRVEEFLNFFHWTMAPPENGDAFAIHVDGAPSRFGGRNSQLLRIGIRGREVQVEERPDAVLTFVIDTSGSMARENRLGLVKRALRVLVNELRPSDQVALVEYGTQARVVLRHRPVRDRAVILDTIDRLCTSGSTNAEAGLVTGYGLASDAFERGAINRVILCTDGVANVGLTGADGILGRIRGDAERGITLTAVGFGMDNFNDVLLERLADEGDGMYAYVDTLSEARRVFSENLTGTLEIIAREARAQVDFNPAVVRSYRLLGYENRDIADERFRDDTVDAGEIGAGHRVTVLVELKLWDEASGSSSLNSVEGEGVLGTVHLRYGLPDSDRFEEIARTITRGDLAPSFEAASPELRLAACVAEMAEVLRGSYWARERDLDEVLDVAREASGQLDRSNTDAMEFLNLLAQARDLQNREVPAGTGG